MFFKSDDTNYSYKDINTILEKECSDIVIKSKPTQVKVLPNNKNNNTYNNTFKIKVKPNLNNIKSQGWHHS